MTLQKNFTMVVSSTNGDDEKHRRSGRSSSEEEVVYNVRISSVGPGRPTPGELVKEQSGVDLAMKLHYLRGVYFFTKESAKGITAVTLKESMFYLLNDYYLACGRFRRSDDDHRRPYMKCNDCGVRFVEAECGETVEDWIRDNFSGRGSNVSKLLVYHLPLGPELFFSPPVYLQVTKFNCGGISLGLSWAHIIGDIFSATDFMNSWAKFLAGLKSNKPFQQIIRPIIPGRKNPDHVPLSFKRVNPVGDIWVTANTRKMETFTFRLNAAQSVHLHSKITGHKIPKNSKITTFESIASVMWQSIAKIREGTSNEPRRVTICKKDYDSDMSQNVIIDNSRTSISSILADFSVANSDLEDLAKWMSDQIGNSPNEKPMINVEVDKDDGESDYIVYGANLTFVDYQGVDLNGLECNGCKPRFVHFEIQGVGDEGAVLVLPWPQSRDGDGNQGRVVTAILPENEVGRLKLELEKIGVLLDANSHE